ALLGRTVSGVLAEDGRSYQVCLMPVSAGGHVFGALLLGRRLGRELAQEIAGLTGSDVTFVSNGAVTGSTVEGADARAALLHTLDRPRGGEMAALVSGTQLDVRDRSTQWDAFVRAVPQSTPEKRQFYVLTRPRDAELGSIRSLGTGLLALGLILALAALVLGV